MTRNWGGFGHIGWGFVLTVISFAVVSTLFINMIADSAISEEKLDELCKQPMMAITSKLGQPINKGYAAGLARWTYIDHIYYFEVGHSGCRVTGERI